MKYAKFFILLVFVAGVIFSCTKKEPFTPLNSYKFMKFYGKGKKDVGNDFLQTSDGGYIIVGSVTDYFTADYSGDDQFYILKIDKFGNKDWSLSLGDSLLNDQATGVVATTDGNYAVVGTKEVYYADSSGKYSNMYLVKVSESGTILFENDSLRADLSNTTDLYSANDIVEKPDGELVLIGSQTIGSKSTPYIFRLSSSGEIVAKGAIGQDLTNYRYFASNGIYKNLDGKDWIITIGQSEAQAGLVTESEGNWNIQLIKVDMNEPTTFSNEAEARIGGGGEDLAGMLLNDQYGERFFLVGSMTVGVGSSAKKEAIFGTVARDFENNAYLTLENEVRIKSSGKNVIGKTACRTAGNDGFVVVSEAELENGQYDIQLTYISNTGVLDDTFFEETYGYTTDEKATKIISTLDGGYAILGSSLQGNDQKILLIKTDDKGEVN